MSKFSMNRIMEDSGETNLRLQAASYVDTRIPRAILDHQHDAGTDWLGEFETEINDELRQP